MTKEQEAKQRAKISAWQKEGATKEALRKQRNHHLIHLGLAVIDMIRKEKLSIEDVLKHVEILKQDDSKALIEMEIAEKE